MGNSIGHINNVKATPSQLVLRLVTTYGRWLSITISKKTELTNN